MTGGLGFLPSSELPVAGIDESTVKVAYGVFPVVLLRQCLGIITDPSINDSFDSIWQVLFASFDVFKNQLQVPSPTPKRFENGWLEVQFGRLHSFSFRLPACYVREGNPPVSLKKPHLSKMANWHVQGVHMSWE